MTFWFACVWSWLRQELKDSSLVWQSGKQTPWLVLAIELSNFCNSYKGEVPTRFCPQGRLEGNFTVIRKWCGNWLIVSGSY